MPSPEPVIGRCGARVKPKPEQGREGGYCVLPPMTGQTRCRVHGGAARQNRVAAQRREGEAKASQLAVTYGLPVRIDPVDALLHELWRTQGAVLWLEAQIRQLDPQELIWGQKEVTDKQATEFSGIDRTEAALIHGFMALYQAERAHLAKLSKDCVAVGIALKEQERMASLAEQLIGRMRTLAAALGADIASPVITKLIVTILQTGAPPARAELEA